MSRITEHPIIPIEEEETFTFTYDGQTVTAKRGETVAAALLAAGYRVFRYTEKKHSPRGIFCGIGQCTDCIMVINGIPNQRTCMTQAEPGMDVRTQIGVGTFGKDEAHE